jgi:DNA-binding HxlR family transcriptional regulator
MSPAEPARRSGCPISISLEIFGDRWSLLIVRDLLFKGLRTFREFAAAGEGIATNILTDRLERLECADIITRAPDPEDGRRVVYRLTRKGMELAPVLVEMVLWAARHEDTEAPPSTLRAMQDRASFIDALWAQWRGESHPRTEKPAGRRPRGRGSRSRKTR